MEIEPPLKRISFGKQRYVEFLTNSIQGQDKTPKGNETNVSSKNKVAATIQMHSLRRCDSKNNCGSPQKLHTTDGRAAKNKDNWAARITNFVLITKALLPSRANYRSNMIS
jgi:hypothetical protein